MRTFSQVDVFSAEPFLGNPVAVVHDAEGLSDEEMAGFANWTNLSETTFLLPPTTDEADYRLRIFTPSAELPFAGHPTIGSAHAWLEAGGVPRRDGELVQECGVGLVRLRRGTRLAFAAPPFLRSGEVSEEDRERIVRALRIDPSQVVDLQWIDNGPGWVGVLMGSADEVLAIQPDWSAAAGMDIGVVGPYPDGSECAVEVRAFCRVRDLRGPRDRQPQRRSRPVAGRRPAAVVVRRLPGHRARSPRAGVRGALSRRGDRHRVGGR